jgi:hypothetical protein
MKDGGNNSTKKRMFPDSLYKACIDKRIDYFFNLTIRHPFFDTVSKELLDTVLGNETEPLILVIGPSRTGKSTLKKWLEKQLYTFWTGLSEKDTQTMPFVSVEAIASGYGNFRWKDYYIRSLSAMNEPMIDKKVLYGDEEGLSVHGTRGSTAALRRALEKALEYRKPLAFIFDEAQHITKVSQAKLEEQLDSIKSLANLTNIKHVLFGTYELLEFIKQTSHLINRCRDIHFPRYNVAIEDDKIAFMTIISTFERHLPVEQVPDLVQHWDFLYERTIGCIGVLKQWLTHALKLCLNNSDNTIELKHLKKTAPSSDKALKNAKEIIKGEANFTDDEKIRERLQALLGLIAPDDNRSKYNGNKKPGQQKPRRYPVGKIPGFCKEKTHLAENCKRT